MFLVKSVLQIEPKEPKPCLPLEDWEVPPARGQLLLDWPVLCCGDLTSINEIGLQVWAGGHRAPICTSWC